MDSIQNILNSSDLLPFAFGKRQDPTAFSPNMQEFPFIKQFVEKDNIEVDSQLQPIHILDESFLQSQWPDIQDELESPSQSMQKNSSNDRLENKDRIIYEQKKLQFPGIFTASYLQKNENAIRFIIRMAVEYFPQYMSEFSPQIGAKIIQKCINLKNWRLENTSKNNYNTKHLPILFSKDCQQVINQSRKSRQLFHKILSDKWRSGMNDPKSQIKNKVEYLRVVKVFKLRCKSQRLSMRTQSR